jgi:hypothetical protein
MENITTHTDNEPTPIDIDALKKMFDGLKDMPEPEGFIMIPSFKGFDMYKIKAKTLGKLLKLVPMIENDKHGLFNL